MSPRLFRHYRQYAGLSDEEVNARKRVEAAAAKSAALERVAPLDLARTTWPEYPPSRVVDAVTFAARRGLHRYVDRRAPELSRAVAAACAVPVERVVVGAGAAALLGGACSTLLAPRDELITPWPSYGLYPLLARRADAVPVPVAGLSADAVLAAVTPRTRAVVLCNPNDPTGALLPVSELAALLRALPERVVVLLDEALRDFVSVEPVDAALRLTDAFPRLVVVRTFSKAWGLAGLRVGYAVGGVGSASLLERLAPELGVDELAQAGALEVLTGSPELASSRGEEVARLRALVVLGLEGYEVTASQANVLWLRRPGTPGAALAARLRDGGVAVAPGGPLGDEERVRLTVPHREELLPRVLRALT